MDDGDPHDEIVRLEARMEELTVAIESCRKFMLLGRTAIILGAALIAALMLGALQFDGLALLIGITAVIGGIVLFGSNSGTRAQATAEFRAAEDRRTALIGRIDLHVVGGTDMVH